MSQGAVGASGQVAELPLDGCLAQRLVHGSDQLVPPGLPDLVAGEVGIKAAVLHSAVGELAFGDPLWVGVGEIHLRLEGLGESGGGDDDDVRLARFYADHQRIPGEWRDALDGRLWSRVHCSSMPPSARR
ncbi:hypothetical protein SDC9_134254 [bioreactor metagenome]|uniref:Uncharacterized protein n=1 Tax=bioreactor metagenome TaxID=1076179 RepID=A0A645DCE5_9ZZZZ